MNAELDPTAPQALADENVADVGEYRRRLLGETQTSLEVLQRSFGGADTSAAVVEIPEGIELRYGYQVGDYGFLHDPGFPVQVTEAPPMFSLPNTRPWCLGLANLRGNLTPVYDLAMLLGIEAPRRRNKLLVVGAEEDAVAILINDTPTQVRIETDKASAVPGDVPEFLARNVRASFTLDSGRWFELNYPGLFADLQELAEIS